MKDRQYLHAAIMPLLEIVQDIMTQVPTGQGATDSFWMECSVDCHILEFGDEFRHEREPRAWVQFYPGVVGTGIYGIRSIGVITPDVILEVDADGDILEVTRAFPRFEYGWTVRSKKDRAAHLVHLQAWRKRGEGSVSYGSFYPTSDGWSHGVTMGYPWTKKTPETLKGRTHIEGRRIPFTVSVKEKVQEILRLGKFEKFKEQLERQKNRKAA